MLKLVNLSTYKYDLERFNCDYKKINNFLNKHSLHGIELLNPLMWQEGVIPKDAIKGVHLKYYPIWLDFWNNNKKELIAQFENMDNVEVYYGGKDRECIIDQYKKEIKLATELGAEYVVFHVGHVQLNHVYSYDFTYTDGQIIDATVELVNEIFKDLDTNIQLLFENVWWPGLTMRDKNIVSRLMEEIEYPNKGFMLDTAHLMNSNLNLESEKEGIEFILDTITDLGAFKNYIKGIHLSCSLSKDYVLKEIENSKKFKSEMTYSEMNIDSYRHVINIDEHKPFTDKSIKKLIDFINPEYLVYEFITYSLQELETYIERQDECCCIDKS